MQEPVEDEYDTDEISEMVLNQLRSMRVDELRSLAGEHGIDVSGLRAKAELVDAIALYPRIAQILAPVRDEPEEGEMPPSLVEEELGEEVKEELQEEPEVEPEPEDLADRVSQALRASVDFSVLERFLSEAATKFSERSFDAAVQTAKDSVLKIEEKVKDYVEASWAFAIASTQKILETSGSSGKAAKEAKKWLEEAKEVFKEGSFIRSPDLLEHLCSGALSLYAHEMDKARAHLSSQESALKEIKAMGGDVTTAGTMLGKASKALDENHRASYLDVVGEADSLVDRAREIRIEELKAASASVASTIEEARSIGAGVEKAANLLEDVRKAFDSNDYVAANDLVSRAEQVALESQKSHMDRVANMRDQQIEKVKALISKIKPAIDRARTEGFQANEALADLKAAVDHVNAGDYVSALVRAKRAYGTVKEFNSGLEAQRLEAAPIPVEEPVELQKAKSEEEPPSPPPPACIHCGSEDLEIGKRGKARCRSCGRKFRL